MADKPFLNKEIPLNGKLITSVDPVTIDINFQELKNLRYTDTGLRAVAGMSKINSTAITTYTNIKGGFHFNKAEPSAESHVLIQAFNSGDANDSKIFQNTTAIPSTGDFSATALYNDSSNSNNGYFSDAPGGAVVYCDGESTMIWGGDEHFCSGFTVTDGTDEYDYFDVINNTLTDSSNIATLKHTIQYVGSIQPLTKIKYYVGTANTDTTDTLTVEYWNGAAWVDTTTAGGSVTDGTEVANARMAQTGTVEFPDRTALTKVKIINGILIYWYKVTVAGVDAGTKINRVSVSFPFQDIKDMWNGAYSPVDSFFTYASGNTFYEGTAAAYALDYTSANTATAVILNSLATGNDYIAIGFSEQMIGLDIVLVSSSVNNTAATSLTLEYWNGTAWVSVVNPIDGTSQSSISFAKSGIISWDEIAKETEFKRNITDGITNYYYYKLSFDKNFSNDVKLDFVGGIPKPKEIQAYKFPVFAHNRVFLCGNQNEGKHSVLPSAQDAANVFNGDETVELHFGDAKEITAGIGLFRQYGSSLLNLTVFTKSDETWILVGNGPEDWIQYKASDTIGCASPATMIVANVGFEAVPTQNRYVAIWQGLEGIYLFDGTVIREISSDISDRFDKRNTAARLAAGEISHAAINTNMIAKSIGFFDYQHQEYHWLYASGSSTSLDKEMVYDLVRQKWYEIDRGTGEQLQMGILVTDTNGNRYNYGGESDGYIYRLDNSNKFEDNSIVSTFRFGDLALGGQEGGSINTLTRLRKIKLVTSAKTSTSNSVVLTYYGDGTTTGTALTTMSPTNSGYRTTQVVNGTNQGRFTFHDLKFSMTTDDESIPFEPYFVGLLFTEEGYDLN